MVSEKLMTMDIPRIIELFSKNYPGMALQFTEYFTAYPQNVSDGSLHEDAYGAPKLSIQEAFDCRTLFFNMAVQCGIPFGKVMYVGTNLVYHQKQKTKSWLLFLPNFI